MQIKLIGTEFPITRYVDKNIEDAIKADTEQCIKLCRDNNATSLVSLYTQNFVENLSIDIQQQIDHSFKLSFYFGNHKAVLFATVNTKELSNMQHIIRETRFNTVMTFNEYETNSAMIHIKKLVNDKRSFDYTFA